MMSVSPFAAKLGTNFVPCDTEIEGIRAYIQKPLSHLAKIEDGIAELQTRLHELISKRDSLKVTIDLHMALISPMRRVPEDILREIFEYCMSTGPFALVDATRAPLLLTRICRHWRQIAHSMPTLWSSIHIPGSSFSQPGGIGGMLSFNSDVVAAWLNRTKGTNQALSISMSFRSVNQTLGLSFADVFPRLRRLELTLESGDNLYMQPFLRQKARDLPRLECLKIDSKEDSGPNFWPNSVILGLPTLRIVSLRIRADPMKLPLPWSELVELDLRCFFSATSLAAVFVGGLSVADALDVLRQCTRLRICTLQVTRGGQFQPRAVASVAELQELTVTDAIFLPQFLERVDAPNLRRLTLTPKAGREDEDRAAVLRGFQAHAPHLTGVDLVVTLFNTQTLTAFLGMVPALRELVLRAGTTRGEGPTVLREEHILDNSVLGSLTPMAAADRSAFCPLLAHVEFVSCALFSDWKLLEFIRGRMTCQPEPALRSVVVSFERPMHRDILPALATQIAAGLRVQLEYAKAAAWKYNPRTGLCEL
ncbi:hypothetical protein C8F01DRAFT_1112897 [Mycena amicta]|nr:hypothetical protein C8F01DRAFT_1112897 [Mycena amicta]